MNVATLTRLLGTLAACAIVSLAVVVPLPEYAEFPPASSLAVQLPRSPCPSHRLPSPSRRRRPWCRSWSSRRSSSANRSAPACRSRDHPGGHEAVRARVRRVVGLAARSRAARAVASCPPRPRAPTRCPFHGWLPHADADPDALPLMVVSQFSYGVIRQWLRFVRFNTSSACAETTSCKPGVSPKSS